MSALEEIQARIEAATPGPWTRSDYVDIDQDGAFDLAHVTAPDPHEPDAAVFAVSMGILREDAEFIAHARDDVPKLLDVLDAVTRLHSREVIAVHEGYGEEAICTECGHRWPCPTTEAIAPALGGEA